MNPIEHFNKNNRIKYWSKNKEEYQRWFRRMLEHLRKEIKDGATEKELSSFIYRSIGSHGIGKPSGIPSGVYTEKSLTEKKVVDHVIGGVMMGRYVHTEFERNNWDTDYMVNEWLYENLWVWVTIVVSHTEHHKDNIIRNMHTIEEKKELKHYKNVSSFGYKF